MLLAVGTEDKRLTEPFVMRMQCIQWGSAVCRPIYAPSEPLQGGLQKRGVN